MNNPAAEIPKSYVFSMNGAAIKHWDGPRALDRAMAQARQWKANNPEKRILVEEHEYLGRDGGYRRTGRDVQIEIPTLVPELTSQHDFEFMPALGGSLAYPAQVRS